MDLYVLSLYICILILLEEKEKDKKNPKTGFAMQLVNHGVDSTVMEKVKEEVEGFYKLPLEEKMKYKIREGEVEGYGTIEREDGKFDWADRFYMITNPILLRKPHLFPQLPSSLRFLPFFFHFSFKWIIKQFISYKIVFWTVSIS